MDRLKNRRSLEPGEAAAIDQAVSRYEADRETIKAEFLEAHTRYRAAVYEAKVRRDLALLDVLERSEADHPGWQGTQSRIAEHLGTNATYLSKRLRTARQIREIHTENEVAPGSDATSTHEP